MVRRLASFLVLLVPSVALAQGWIEPDVRRPVMAPSAVVRISSAVRATIDGRVARFEVEERFQNKGGGLAEGVYLYPLPTDAAFSNFSLFQGDQELRGEVMSADRAQQIYEDIVRRKRDPALLTLAGHGLIRAQVFPIAAGETRTVILRYTQVLGREGDALRLRYSLGTRGDSARVSFAVTLKHAGQFGRPYSPTHPVTSTEAGDELRTTLGSLGSGEIQLLVPARRGLVSGSILTNATPGERGHFLLFISPPAGDDRETLPRDLSLVVDVSGSMSGDKLDQAKAALQQALGTLRPADRFRLIAFSTAVRPFREGFVQATAENIREARRFVSTLEAGGGTNIAGALDAALGGEAPEHLPLLVFLTDGLPSVGEQAPDRIAVQAAAKIGRTRVFPVGIGHDVNTYLIDRLAVEGRGTALFISPGANVEEPVSALMSKLARPALTNVRIVDAPVRFEQQSPAALPDLFFGEELVILGRYQGNGDGPVVIEGDRNGHRERFEIAASFPRFNNDNEFVGALWATRRIGDLSRELRLEGRTAERIAAIRELGLRYGVITEYTSYLVQEPDAVAAMERRDSPLRSSAAPQAATGAVAFRRAKESAELSKAMTLNELVVTGASDASSGGHGSAVRRIGSRIFVDKDGTWTDASQLATVKPVSVAPYSAAYFELLRAVPELAQLLIKDQKQVIAGKRASILFDATGKTEWAAGELATLARDFRGQ